MWVLIETIATKQNNKPYYLYHQTAIGPATTSILDNAQKFATRQEAIEHPAHCHWLTDFQPFELVESVEPVLVSYSAVVPLPSDEFGIFTVTRLPQFDRPWPDRMEVSGPAERFPATPEGWRSACELAGRRNGFVDAKTATVHKVVPFSKLALGARFRYTDRPDLGIWVKLNNTGTIAEWDPVKAACWSALQSLCTVTEDGNLELEVECLD